MYFVSVSLSLSLCKRDNRIIVHFYPNNFSMIFPPMKVRGQLQTSLLVGTFSSSAEC